MSRWDIVWFLAFTTFGVLASDWIFTNVFATQIVQDGVLALSRAWARNIGKETSWLAFPAFSFALVGLAVLALGRRNGVGFALSIAFFLQLGALGMVGDRLPFRERIHETMQPRYYSKLLPWR